MSPRKIPELLPGQALLLLEGGDERVLCQRLLTKSRLPGVCFWYGDGRHDLLNLAELAAADPNIHAARSVSVVLDTEDDPEQAEALATRCLRMFEASAAPRHAEMTGTKRLGVFYLPGAGQPGALETLCRSAVLDATAAACVDAMQACIQNGEKHLTKAQRDKSWMEAYFATMADPGTRLHLSFKDGNKALDGIDPAHPVFDPLRNFLAAL